jgi:hypothetical protein
MKYVTRDSCMLSNSEHDILPWLTHVSLNIRARLMTRISARAVKPEIRSALPAVSTTKSVLETLIPRSNWESRAASTISRLRGCLYRVVQTVHLIIIFVFGMPARETLIPACGPTRQLDCSRDSCVRSIGRMPCACLTPSVAVWLAQCIARSFILGCA